MILPGLASTAAAQPLKVDWGLLTPVYGKQIMVLALAGLLLAVLRARWFGPVLALWIGLLFMSSNQGIIPLPGSNFINLTSVEIMFFLPLSALAGYFASFIVRWAWHEVHPGLGTHALIRALLAAGSLAAALAGARLMLPILNPVTILAREADRPAIQWIAENINPDETILINPFLWGYGIYAGQDGGYWITPLAGRKTMPPPMLYAYGSAAGSETGDRDLQTGDRAGREPAGVECAAEGAAHPLYLYRAAGRRAVGQTAGAERAVPDSLRAGWDLGVRGQADEIQSLTFQACARIILSPAQWAVLWAGIMLAL